MESTGLSPASSEYCDYESGSWVTTALSLMRSRPLFSTQAYRDLADGSEDELKARMELEADRLGAEFDVSDSRWLDARGLGDVSYGFAYTTKQSSGTKFEFFRFYFFSGFVDAAIAMKFPPGSVTDEEALALAVQFDERIESEIASVRAVRR